MRSGWRDVTHERSDQESPAATIDPIVSSICAILRGSRSRQPPERIERLLNVARAEGVEPLLAWRLHRHPDWPSWPAALREPLTRAARRAALAEVVRRTELQRMLAALAAAGTHALIMKGAALAYSHYPLPHLRPRCDTDLFVATRDATTVARVFTEAGYHRWTLTPGALVMPQVTYVRVGRSGQWHAYDVHTRISNPIVFARCLAFDEVAQRCVRLPTLAPTAHALGQLDALLLACLHRVAHHNDCERLIWLYDIHVIAQRMGKDVAIAFARMAVQKELRAVCHRGLTLAREHFATEFPSEAMALLAAGGRREATAAYLGGPSRLVRLVSDLIALDDWQSRLELLREHLFPSAAYMRHTYAVSAAYPIPMLHAHRICRGAWKWLQR